MQRIVMALVNEQGVELLITIRNIASNSIPAEN